MTDNNLAKQILESALDLAESDSWENLHLHAIAENLGISLEQIRQYYPQKDDIVEAWFDRADQAVLTITPDPEFLNLNARERLQHVIMTWFDALSPHRRVTKQMLLYKFEFGHIHLQALGIMRISRTVQWFREAARIDSINLRRIVEETGTTGIYLLAFTKWLHDESQGSWKTREFLGRALQKGEQCATLKGLF